jgi:threonylcarbamoyladenosine tRNA methylthiotransferase MtaB
MFPYSPRKRTRAALYPNQVGPDVIRRRKQELLRLAEKTAFELRNRFIGRKMPVLLENEEKDGMFFGHTPNFLRVMAPKQNFQPNDLIELELIENTPAGLLGRPI